MRNQNNWIHLFKKFFVEEDGQSTTEYILILAVVVMIGMKFKEKFSSTMTGATEQLDGKLKSIFNDM